MKFSFHSKSDRLRIASNDQILATLGNLIIIGWGAILIFIPPNRFSSNDSNWWAWASGLIIYIFIEIWNLFWLLRLERHRFAAIDDDRWLAHRQPITTSSEVPRFEVMSWRIKWTYITPWLLIGGWWLGFARWQLPVLLLIIILVVFCYSSIRLKIAFTEDGLTKQGPGPFKKVVKYSEARFFAYYRVPILYLGTNIIHYELSSQTTRISWMWVSNPQSPLTAWINALPMEEQDQHIQMLCAFIMEKTGLPLYDLNQDISKES
jgi:hypothetical protein